MPLGRGLGAGGNLGDNFASIDWSAAQQAGAIDGAAESAVGVLLYQMGVAALAPLTFYFMIGLKAWRLYARSGMLPQGLVAFGILCRPDQRPVSAKRPCSRRPRWGS